MYESNRIIDEVNENEIPKSTEVYCMQTSKHVGTPFIYEVYIPLVTF